MCLLLDAHLGIIGLRWFGNARNAPMNTVSQRPVVSGLRHRFPISTMEPVKSVEELLDNCSDRSGLPCDVIPFGYLACYLVAKVSMASSAAVRPSAIQI